MKRFLLALLLALAAAPAFAQAPPPVPALPDTERRTSYTISGTTCACAVGFQIYGDGSDFANWIDVWLNGVNVNSTDPTFGWTLTSPSGPLSSIARPITDAVVTFTNPQTGTVQIVGARRPRRTSQFPESRGVAARDFNQVLTDIIAGQREIWDKTNDMTGRGLFFAPGNSTGPMPQPSACAGNLLGFDATGLNPFCYSAATGTGTVNSTQPTVAGNIATYNNLIGTSITDSGISLTSEPANRVLAGPAASSGAATFRLLVGADLPNPSSSTLGGVQSAAPITHQFLTGISTSGVPTFGQPAVGDAQNTAANTVNGNFTGGSAAPAANAMPSCSGSNTLLNYTSGTGIGCKTYQPAATTSTAAGPLLPSSTSVFTMAGIAGTITPATTGRVSFTISGNIQSNGNTGVSNGLIWQLAIGTGSAPANGAAAAGVVVGTTQSWTNPTTITAAALNAPFSITVTTTALTVGTTYWFDLQIKGVGSTNYQVANATAAAFEQ